ncbi:hypothetical protein M426DRAFT_316286 [Hypoxylon sp. CI-4A]|nr:hypothetical protein M426DRAFT_316286 [Hypoxylon sp. CI-4A]
MSENQTPETSKDPAHECEVKEKSTTSPSTSSVASTVPNSSTDGGNTESARSRPTAQEQRMYALYQAMSMSTIGVDLRAAMFGDRYSADNKASDSHKPN